MTNDKKYWGVTQSSQPEDAFKLIVQLWEYTGDLMEQTHPPKPDDDNLDRSTPNQGLEKIIMDLGKQFGFSPQAVDAHIKLAVEIQSLRSWFKDITECTIQLQSLTEGWCKAPETEEEEMEHYFKVEQARAKLESTTDEIKKIREALFRVLWSTMNLVPQDEIMGSKGPAEFISLMETIVAGARYFKRGGSPW